MIQSIALIVALAAQIPENVIDDANPTPIPSEMWARSPVPEDQYFARISAARRLYNECFIQTARIQYSNQLSPNEILARAVIECRSEHAALQRSIQIMLDAIGSASGERELERHLAIAEADAREQLDSIIDFFSRAEL